MTNELPLEQAIEPVELNLEDFLNTSVPTEQSIGQIPLAIATDDDLQALPSNNSLKQKVEAVLYLKGQAMNLVAIASVLGCEVEDAEMGLIVETEAGFALRLRSEFADLVNKLIPVDLGRGALRTLAAIALKKNILQSELIELRGAGAYQHVQELVEQGFVKKKRQAEGRSSVLQLTSKFHQYFEIDDLTKL